MRGVRSSTAARPTARLFRVSLALLGDGTSVLGHACETESSDEWRVELDAQTLPKPLERGDLMRDVLGSPDHVIRAAAIERIVGGLCYDSVLDTTRSALTRWAASQSTRSASPRRAAPARRGRRRPTPRSRSARPHRWTWRSRRRRQRRRRRRHQGGRAHESAVAAAQAAAIGRRGAHHDGVVWGHKFTSALLPPAYTPARQPMSWVSGGDVCAAARTRGRMDGRGGVVAIVVVVPRPCDGPTRTSDVR